jgi:hypothetical protein
LSNFPPAWSVQRMISSAGFLCVGWASTGMPRPLSRTVTLGPVLVQRDLDLVGVAVHGLVDRVVEDLPDEVVQPGRPVPADVHARRLRTGSRPSRTVMLLAL